MHLTRYRDPFDTWVRVAHEDILRLNYEFSIHSPESRIMPSWVYLHDSDAEGLIAAAEAAGHTVKVTDHAVQNRSTIRYLPTYRVDFLSLIPYVGCLFEFDETGDVWRIADERYTSRSGKVILERVTGDIA